MKLRKIFEILFLIIILAIIAYKVDLKESWVILQTINLNLFILALVIDIILLFFIALSLKVLFDTIIPTKMNEWLALYIPGFLSGLVLPARAGDITTMLLAKKKGFEIGQSTTLILLDKLITLLVFIPITILGIFTLMNSKELYYGIGFSLLLILGILTLYTPIGRKLFIKILGKHSEKFKGFSKTFREELKYHKKALLINLFLTALRPILNGIIIIILLQALGFDLSLFNSIIISSITLIVTIVPLTPNGFGLREGIGTILLYQVGIPYEVSIAMYMIFLVLNFCLVPILGAYYFMIKDLHNS